MERVAAEAGKEIREALESGQVRAGVEGVGAEREEDGVFGGLVDEFEVLLEVGAFPFEEVACGG